MDKILVRLIIWLWAILAWWAIIYYHSQLVKIFWRNAWFERNLGSTEMGYILLWILIMMIGFLVLLWFDFMPA